MAEFLLITLTVLVLTIVYFNSVATLLVFKTPGTATLFNVFRTLFIWLVPVIGFAFFLRFTRQSFESELHYKLLPKIVRAWVYDDRLEPVNPNADRMHNRAVNHGLAEMSRELIREHRDSG